MSDTFELGCELRVLKNEIEYLKRRVAELERVNLYKANSCTAVAGWPKANESTRWLSKDEVKGD